jgi:hypothetical protein
MFVAAESQFGIRSSVQGIVGIAPENIRNGHSFINSLKYGGLIDT